MPDASSADPRTIALGAATFLIQALQLPGSPAAIAAELSSVREDSNAAIYSLELDSSIGAAAFLVYAYDFRRANAEGASGEQLYREGLSTLQLVAERDTPGPRMVAHADTDTMGFILATTPATWRALQGGQSISLVATEADLPPTSVTGADRASLAEDLHRSFKRINDQAAAWLAAIRSTGANDGEDMLTFTEEETALALFVLDSTNIEATLAALNLLVTSARQQAGTLVTRSQAASADGAGTIES
jgi:hypothetical protein